MKCNAGGIDRAVRAVLGIALAVVAATSGATGAAQIALYAVGGVLLATAAMGFCPLYTLLGLNTCRAAR